jgi:hypothetical protein
LRFPVEEIDVAAGTDACTYTNLRTWRVVRVAAALHQRLEPVASGETRHRSAFEAAIGGPAVVERLEELDLLMAAASANQLPPERSGDALVTT